MKVSKFLGLLGLSFVLAWIGSGLLVTWPVVTVLCTIIAAYWSMTEAQRAKWFGTASPVATVILWAGTFFLVQIIVGSTFGVSLQDVYDKAQSNVFAMMVDPIFMGKAFLAQVVSLLLSGLVAYLYVKSKRRTWVLYPAVAMCLAYLVYSTAIATSPQFRAVTAAFVAKGKAILHGIASRTDTSESFDRLEAETPVEVTVPVEGIVLWQDAERLVEVEKTKEGSTYFIFLDDREEGDDGLFYVFARNTKNTATAGRFSYVEIRKYVAKALSGETAPEPKPKSGPSTPLPKPATLPAPSVLVGAAPSVAPPSNITKDRLVVADKAMPSQIIPYYRDTVVVKTDSDRKEDIARISVSWGGRQWIAVTPQFWDGHWIGILDFVQSTNPLNQPLLLQVTSGTPLAVNLEKVRRS